MWWIVPAMLLAACGGGRQTTAKGRLDSGIEKLIPPETVVLAGVDVQEVLKSPVYEKFVAARGLPDELDDFAKRTGLDPKRDVEHFYIAADGSRTLAVAQVNVRDRAALEKEIQDKGAGRTEIAGHAVFTAGGKGFALVDAKTAVAGPMDLVRGALEGYQGDAARRQAVLEKLKSLPGGGQMWAVSVGGFPPMPIPERGNIANLNRVFASLESSTLSVDLSNGIALAAAGQCADEKMAKQLHDTLKGLIGFGRLSTPSDKPEMLKLFDGIEVEQAKGAVSVNAKVPPDMLDFLLGQMKRQ